MSMEDTFLEQTDFSSYEDFRDHLKIRVPPGGFNFAYDIVDAYAEAEPERRALCWCNDHGEERLFTFADMKAGSDRAAQVFHAHGVRRGDSVLLALKNRYEFWFCINALHKIGAVAVPATHMLTEHDLEYRFERARIKMLVAAPDEGLMGYIDSVCAKLGHRAPLRSLVNGKRDGWIDFSAEMAAADGKWQRPADTMGAKAHDPMLFYFSSGTTGHPKMVAHDYLYPLAHIVTAKYWHHVQDGGLHYTVADTGWAKSVWGNLYGQWICGSAVFIHDYERFQAARTLELLAKFGVKTFCAPPTVYRFLIKENIEKHDFSSLDYAVVAGEPLNPEVFERFKEATGLLLMESYGQTEMTVGVGNFVGMTPKQGSMGRPNPLYRIRLEKPDGSVCEIGEHGELVVPLEQNAPRPIGLFIDYHGQPEATAHATRGGVYHTGDIAWQDEDGYLWYVGRDDDLIKSSGYRIGPFEVESALMEHPSVLECAVTGVPDPDRGQVVKATIVLTREYRASEKLVKELQEHVKKATAPYKYPRVVEFVPELPKTISGKIRRVEIRQKDQAKSER
jgi:acetyl-CoA synthetase